MLASFSVPATGHRGAKPCALRNVSGNVAAIWALAILPIFGVIALTLDTRNVMNIKSQMQSASDAATIMAAIELLKTDDDQNVKLVAEQAFQTKVAEHTHGLSCNMTSFSIKDSRDSVSITWMCNEPSYVAQTIGQESMSFPVMTTAEFRHGVDGCVLALGEYNWTGVEVTGSADVQLDSCAVISNSRQDSSINMSGSGALTATCAYSAGGIQNADTIDVTTCAGPVSNGRPTPDPYEELSVPEDVATWPCQEPVSTGKDTLYLPSGRYCKPISAKDELVLETGGTFVFDGGDLRMKSAWSSLQGEEVTLIFMNNAEFENANGGQVDLTAKSEGDYAGILMYGDRETMDSWTDIKINGNINTRFEGVIYFPNNDLTFVGGSSAISECTQLVADTISFSGNSNLQANCEALGAKAFGSVSEVYITE